MIRKRAIGNEGEERGANSVWAIPLLPISMADRRAQRSASPLHHLLSCLFARLLEGSSKKIEGTGAEMRDGATTRLEARCHLRVSLDDCGIREGEQASTHQGIAQTFTRTPCAPSDGCDRPRDLHQWECVMLPTEDKPVMAPNFPGVAREIGRDVLLLPFPQGLVVYS